MALGREDPAVELRRASERPAVALGALPRAFLAPLLLTFGLSIVLQNVLQEMFTADTRSLPAGDLAGLGFNLLGVSIGVLPFLSTLASIALLGATHWLVGHTHFGRQARAVSDDPGTARLVGVNDRRFFAVVTGVIFSMIGVAAVLYALRTPFSPTAGPERLLYGSDFPWARSPLVLQMAASLDSTSESLGQSWRTLTTCNAAAIFSSDRHA